MTEHEKLLAAVAATIADYREGEIVRPDAAHVEKWLAQFDEQVRAPLLAEMQHVLGKTYISKAHVTAFLAALVTNANLTGGDPKTFWRATKFLNIQTRGYSQRDFLTIFALPLKAATGLDLAQCGTGCPSRFLYLDDGLYSGNTILNELKTWITNEAPVAAQVFVVTIALHRGGQFYARTRLEAHAKAAGKNVQFHWWRLVELEDRKTYINNSDVLRPKRVPDDERVKKYVMGFQHQPILRGADSVGDLKVFSTSAGRDLLEQEFLKKGCYIREASGNFNVYARPLGNMVLETLGFGATIVTYRNCPNNAPLAFWAGKPWYPLFPRNTN
ncbi:MAG: hypothetical protein QM576_12525 [Rhodopseudomonas sp.]|uniref:phosphoribosyltransferase-like protein n=1 Tax=Rhodopseudomonas sp. TaxID=1078 RepID=UPI0039E366E9